MGACTSIRPLLVRCCRPVNPALHHHRHPIPTPARDWPLASDDRPHVPYPRLRLCHSSCPPRLPRSAEACAPAVGTPSDLRGDHTASQELPPTEPWVVGRVPGLGHDDSAPTRGWPSHVYGCNCDAAMEMRLVSAGRSTPLGLARDGQSSDERGPRTERRVLLWIDARRKVGIKGWGHCGVSGVEVALCAVLEAAGENVLAGACFETSSRPRCSKKGISSRQRQSWERKKRQ